MSHHPPKTLVKSRENLQAISKSKNKTGSHYYSEIMKYEQFDKCLLVIWDEIKRSIPGGSTKHIINLHATNYFPQNHGGNMVNLTSEIVSEFIEILKKEYPGIDFTYKETAGYDGKIIERIIIMDWS
jgi:hypothetical protein